MLDAMLDRLPSGRRTSYAVRSSMYRLAFAIARERTVSSKSAPGCDGQ